MGVGHCDKSARSGFPAVDAEYPLMKTFLMEEGWACAGDEGGRCALGRVGAIQALGRPWELKHLSTKDPNQTRHE